MKTTGEFGKNVVSRTRAYLLLIAVLITVGIVLSLWENIERGREDRHFLAVSSAKAFLQTIIATRSWNSEHGGVYVPVTEKTRPNPYLVDPVRDVVTNGGARLTKINPAYMTRLIGEKLTEEGYAIHITSLKTLRPGNEPDPWERTVLAKFEKGSVSEHAVADSPSGRIFRYMEPLKTEASCLRCHGHQGYKVGDVRGGISVAFPFAPYERTLKNLERREIFHHLFFLGVSLAILLFLGRRILKLVDSLQETRREILALEGILPMCASCKKIRKEGTEASDPDSWVPVADYITKESGARVSHGICPECMKKLYGPGGTFAGE